MTKKILLWVLVIIVLTMSVNAALTDNLVSWYPTNASGIFTDVVSSINGGTSGITFNSTGGILGTGSFRNAGTGIINISTGSTNRYGLTTSTDRTYAFWLKPNSAADTGRAFTDRNGGGTVDMIHQGSANMELLFNDGSWKTIVWNTTANIEDKQNFLVAVFSMGNNVTLYADGKFANSTSLGATFTSGSTGTSFLDYPSGGQDLDADVSLAGVWNRTLAAEEIDTLWNNGDGCQYPFSACNVGNFSITATNNNTGSSITTFNATITNSTFNQTYSTTTGTLTTDILSNSTTLFNITVRSTNFFENTTTNYNITSDYAAELPPYTIINVTTISGTVINNFTINYTFVDNTTVINTVTTTTGTVNLPLFNNTYTVTIFNANQAGTNYASDVVNMTTNPYNTTHTFTLYTTNSVDIVVRDEETREIIDNETVTIDFVSSLEAIQRNTSNGTLFVDLLSPAEIEIIYDADSYRERSYYFNLENQSFTNLTLYLLNTSTGSLVIVENTDTTGEEVEGVTLQLLRGYIIGGVQQFEIVEMDETDFAGEAVVSAELNTPVYQIKVVKNVTDNEILFLSNTPFEITSTLLQIKLDLLEDPLQSFNSWRDIAYTDLSYNSTSALYTVTYTDNAGLINPNGQVCLVVEKIVGVEYVYVNQSCSDAITATLSVFYNDSSHSSVARLIADTNTENSEYILTVIENAVGARQAVAAALGESGAFISALLVYGVGSILIFNPTTYIIGIIAGAMGVFIMGFVNLTWSAAMITLIIMGGILALKMRT